MNYRPVRRKLYALAMGLAMTLFVAQPTLAGDYYVHSYSGSGPWGNPTVFAIAVGLVALASSVDCVSPTPSLPMCQPGGSSYRPRPAMVTLGSMASLVTFHTVVVASLNLSTVRVPMEME